MWWDFEAPSCADEPLMGSLFEKESSFGLFVDTTNHFTVWQNHVQITHYSEYGVQTYWVPDGFIVCQC